MPRKQPARAAWKAAWRRYRINRRELNLAMSDMCLYGTGIYCIDNAIPNIIRHVPIESVWFDVDGTPHEVPTHAAS